MKLLRLSDNKEFINEYYKFLKEFLGIDNDKDNKKIKKLLSIIDSYNFEICAKMQLLFFLYKYKKDDSAKKEFEKHLKFFKRTYDENKRSLNINDI